MALSLMWSRPINLVTIFLSKTNPKACTWYFTMRFKKEIDIFLEGESKSSTMLKDSTIQKPSSALEREWNILSNSCHPCHYLINIENDTDLHSSYIDGDDKITYKWWVMNFMMSAHDCWVLKCGYLLIIVDSNHNNHVKFILNVCLGHCIKKLGETQRLMKWSREKIINISIWQHALKIYYSIKELIYKRYFYNSHNINY